MSELTDWNDKLIQLGSLPAARKNVWEKIKAEELKTQLQAEELQAQRQLAQGEEPPPPDDELLPWESAPDEDEPPTEAAPGAVFNKKDKRFKRTEKKAIKPWSFNVLLILENDAAWMDSLGYCEFSYRIIKQRETIPGCKPGEWQDADTARLKVWVTDRYGFNPGKPETTDALVVAAQKRAFHPVQDYLRSLTWDKVPRLDRWLTDALEAFPLAGDSHYLSLVGSMFLIGAVARVMRAPEPTKMDNVLILEGEQGYGKSSVVKALFGEWFSDAPLQLGDKDAYQNIHGVWGVELGELDSFNKAESTTAKMFFTQMRDRYRPSYGTHAQDFTRQCVFVGTTNQEEYLKDYTGNRRYWPVRCRTVNAAWVREHRDQLWAEAMARYAAGESWWPVRNDLDPALDQVALFEREQDARLQIDPWHYPIENFLREHVGDYVTADVLLSEALKKDKGQQTKADQNRLSPIMKLLGWHKTRRYVPVGGGKTSQRHVYLRPKDWNTPVELPNDA